MGGGLWFLAALGLAFMMEGAGYALFAERFREIILQLEPPALRRLGLVTLVLGFLLVALAARLLQTAA